MFAINLYSIFVSSYIFQSMSSRLKASNISSLTSKGKKKNLEQSLEEEVMAK